MDKYLDSFKDIFGGLMKFMYRILGIFGIVAKDDTTGDQLSDAVDKFAEDIKNA